MIPWVLPVFAQVPSVAVNAEIHRPSVDSTRSLATEESRLPEKWVVRMGIGYQREPLTFHTDAGEIRAIVRDALSVDFAAAGRIGPVRLGAVVPVYPVVTGADRDLGTVMGDPTVEWKVALRERDGWGVAVAGDVGIPLGGDRYHLGDTGPSASIGLVGDLEIERLLVAVNVGGHLSGVQEAREARLGAYGYADLAVSLQVDEALAITAEAHGRLGLVPDGIADDPIEVFLGAHATPEPGRVAPFVAVGTGVNQAIGVPVVRGILGIRYAGGSVSSPVLRTPPPVPPPGDPR